MAADPGLDDLAAPTLLLSSLVETGIELKPKFRIRATVAGLIRS
jgi:hypothetical protein